MEEELNPKSKLPSRISASCEGLRIENEKQKSKRIKWDGASAEVIRLPVTERELGLRLDQFIGIMYSLLASSENLDQPPSTLEVTAPTAEKIQATNLLKPETDKIGLVSGVALIGAHREEEYGISKRAS